MENIIEQNYLNDEKIMDEEFGTEFDDTDLLYDDTDEYEEDIEEAEESYEKGTYQYNKIINDNEYIALAKTVNGTPGTPQERFVFIMNDYHSGDKKLRERAEAAAIAELERFVVTIMKKNYPTYMMKHFEDLLQEGRLGICKGLERYDPSKSKPTTFFYPYIKHEIQGYITVMIDKTTTHYSANIRKINRAIEKFEKSDTPYTPVDIAIQTGMTIETVNQSLAIRDYRDEMHIDACPGNIIDEKATTRITTPEDECIQKEQNEILRRVTMRDLTPDQLKVLKMKYGIFNSKTMSEGQIAKEMHMPKDKVRKLINSALATLRRSELKSVFKDNYRNDSVLKNEADISFVPRESALAEIEDLKNIEL